MCVRAFGTEKRGRLYVTAKRNTGDAQMLLGLEFLIGATIHFEKGTP